MSEETTRTSLTEIVNSEMIQETIISYAIDASVIAPLCRVANLAGRATAVASFPQWELDAVASVNDGSALSNTELQTTEVATVTAASVGVLREVTQMAMATNLLGADGLLRFVVEDGGRLCMADLENSLASRFSGFTTTVGTSGADFSISNFVEGISRMGTKNARGRIVSVIDDQQAFDLRTAVGTSTSAVFANSAQSNQSVLNANTNAFVGELFGVPVWMTNLTDTANTGADVVGAMFIDGNLHPEFAGIGIALLWMPTLRSVAQPGAVAEEMAITMAYGTGRISDFGIDFTTDA